MTSRSRERLESRAEGKTTPIPISGKVADDKKSVTANGSRAKTSVTLNGTIKGDKVIGTMTGKAYGKSFKSKFRASK